MTDRRDHWNSTYTQKPSDRMSWYLPRLATSLALIDRFGPTAPFRIIDVGGGASRLVDDLSARDGVHVTVLDIADAALQVSRERLGDRADAVTWLEADVTTVQLEPASVEIWHDRAVFHFLTDPADRKAYVATMRHALAPGGLAVIATFSLDGPVKCSNLPVVRYSADALAEALGEPFELLHAEDELHHTPSGGQQAFLYAAFRRR